MTSKNILVVEDDKNIRGLLADNFKYQGYDVFTAASAGEALEAAAEILPSLIILDIMLPGTKDGVEICRILKKQEKTAFIPVIMLTAKTSAAEKKTGLRSGADDYVTKPFDIDELLLRSEGLMTRKEELISANSLTSLPGSVSIREEVNKRIEGENNFTFIYLDIDNFKAFNDKYGYDRGDDAIKITSDVLKNAVSEDDFVGHIGGDDFIVLCLADSTDSVKKKIESGFDNNIASLYDEKDARRGYIDAENRQGEVMKFPIMTLSGGAVFPFTRNMKKYSRIVASASELEEKAKQIKKSSSHILVDRRIET